MISSLSLRPAAQRARPSTRARASARSMATARTAARPAARTHRAPAAVRRTRERPQSVTWETRTFGVTALAIAAGFLLAVMYLGQITGVSAHDYEMQRLEARRTELQRQNALLDVQLAKLEAPARIEAQAARLGLLRLSHVPVMSAQELAARK
ncbi:MAG TPA: hypothetical protein VFW12_07000 [Candidatus Limnocylindria bacterium]|nr:hypothetical protein [Candidatus Limnocylindria bacterium]